jgi:glycosyltransferase involved in cell wall biosynthesis
MLPVPGGVEISVVIPAYNAAETIDAQLQALAAQDWGGAWEVLVADNGSTDDTVRRVTRWQGALPGLRVVDASSVQGAGHARNVGARAAQGSTLLFVDADDVVASDWLGHMAGAANHPLFAGSLREAGDFDGDSRAGLGRATRWSAVLSSAGFLDAAASNNLGVSRELWQRIGGFRESLVASEDTAFCWDAQLLGHRIHRVPEAVVRYRMRSSLRQLWRQQYRWGFASVQIYAIYRSVGAPRPSVPGALARWAGLVLMAPVAAFRPSMRRDWVGRTARRAGRLVGSVRCRVVSL